VRGRIWLIDALGKPKAIDVRTGLSDGTATEIIGDGAGTELQEGREVIVGVQGGGSQSAPRSGPPRLFF